MPRSSQSAFHVVVRAKPKHIIPSRTVKLTKQQQEDALARATLANLDTLKRGVVKPRAIAAPLPKANTVLCAQCADMVPLDMYCEHKVSCKPTKPYKCDECASTFNSDVLRLAHKLLNHDAISESICPLCR